jgi:predicted O-methyltransferase YrrM
MGLQRETVMHPHVPEERGDLFLAYGGASTEIEVLNWLYATVILLKPQSILETGTSGGLGTIALASACRANGFGHVHSIEFKERNCRKARARLRSRSLSRYATVYCSESLTFLRSTDLRFDFGFFDSLCEIRAEEYALCRERGILHGAAAFHDTSPHRTRTSKETPAPVHQRYRERLHELAREPGVTGYFESVLSRGLFVIFHNPAA